jgi:hypothetical protein
MCITKSRRKNVFRKAVPKGRPFSFTGIKLGLDWDSRDARDTRDADTSLLIDSFFQGSYRSTRIRQIAKTRLPYVEFFLQSNHTMYPLHLLHPTSDRVLARLCANALSLRPATCNPGDRSNESITVLRRSPALRRQSIISSPSTSIRDTC